VRPGSIVVTDGWKGYSEFKRNDLSSHSVVNQSVEYINSEGYHTNTIDGTWNNIKIKIKIPPQSQTRRRVGR
jgi:hypothetical protein